MPTIDVVQNPLQVVSTGFRQATSCSAPTTTTRVVEVDVSEDAVADVAPASNATENTAASNTSPAENRRRTPLRACVAAGPAANAAGQIAVMNARTLISASPDGSGGHAPGHSRSGPPPRYVGTAIPACHAGMHLWRRCSTPLTLGSHGPPVIMAPAYDARLTDRSPGREPSSPHWRTDWRAPTRTRRNIPIRRSNEAPEVNDSCRGHSRCSDATEGLDESWPTPAESVPIRNPPLVCRGVDLVQTDRSTDRRGDPDAHDRRVPPEVPEVVRDGWKRRRDGPSEGRTRSPTTVRVGRTRPVTLSRRA